MEDTLVVCTDGLIVFEDRAESAFPAVQRLAEKGPAMIAPFHYDIDTSKLDLGWNRPYVEFNQSSLLNWFQTLIRNYTPIQDFEASWVLNALWNSVSRKAHGVAVKDRLGQFQALMCCSRGSEHCFVDFVYGKFKWHLEEGMGQRTVFIKGRGGW